MGGGAKKRMLPQIDASVMHPSAGILFVGKPKTGKTTLIKHFLGDVSTIVMAKASDVPEYEAMGEGRVLEWRVFEGMRVDVLEDLWRSRCDLVCNAESSGMEWSEIPRTCLVLDGSLDTRTPTDPTITSLLMNQRTLKTKTLVAVDCCAGLGTRLINFEYMFFRGVDASDRSWLWDRLFELVLPFDEFCRTLDGLGHREWLVFDVATREPDNCLFRFELTPCAATRSCASPSSPPAVAC